MTTRTRLVLHFILALIALPGMVVVVIPGFLIWQYGFEVARIGEPRFWLSQPLIFLGLALAGWTVALFWIHGKGTPAPWQPPQNFVVLGPYQYVRNPMITAVLMLLTSEYFLFNAPSIGIWGALFFGLNTVYFISFEEPSLEQRFGDDYRLYKAHVGRWIPHLRAWTLPKDHGAGKDQA